MLPTLPPHVPRPDQPVRPEFLSVRASRYLVGMVFAVGMFWAGPGKDVLGPVPVGPQMEVLQRGTTSAMDAVPVIARASLGALPPPADNQLRAPCDADVEREVGGFCWVALKTPPPCPRGKTYEHKGECLMRVLQVKRPPQSGDVRAGNVAGEP